MKIKICGAFTCSNPITPEASQRVYVMPASNAPGGSKSASANFELCPDCIAKYRNNGQDGDDRVKWIENNLKIEMLPSLATCPH